MLLVFAGVRALTFLSEDVEVFVVGRRLYGQQVEHGVEDIVLLEHLGQFTVWLIRPEMLRSPYQEGYLILFLGCQLHGQTVHEHLILAERFAMVGA